MFKESYYIIFVYQYVYTCILGSFVLLLLCLLLGDGMSPSILTAVISLVIFLELFTVAVRVCRDKGKVILVLVIEYESWVCILAVSKLD